MRGIGVFFWAALTFSGSAWSAAAAVEEAQALIARGELQQALARLDSHLGSAPQDAEARFTRGLVLVRLNRNDEAIKAFVDLTRDYPQLPEPYNNLAVIYAQQGDYDKARDALEAALATHPSYPVAHENLGDIYAALAAAAYNRAQALDPANGSVRAKLDLIAQLDGLADSGATVSARPTGRLAAPATPPPSGIVLDEAPIAETVRAWAAAWAAKDADRYLSFYAPSFNPEGGTSRQAWEAQRRARISRPKEISVELSELKITALAEDAAEVSFRQDYRSDLLRNTSTKVLELVSIDGQWRIRREHSR